MKTMTRKPILLLMLLCVAALWAVATAKTLEAATSRAGVAATDNRVEKRIGSGAWQACQVGDLLSPGDGVRTGKDSSASILLTDQTVMRLAANTELRIVDLTEQEDGCLVRRFQLTMGRVFSDVTPSGNKPSVYEIKGPNAVASVRGTAFEVDATDDEAGTDVKVWEGAVECRGQQEGAKAELVKGDSQENHFRVNRAGSYGRLHFGQDQNDPWQVENLETRKNWRKMTAGMARRLPLDQDTFSKFQSARYRLTPEQREKIQQNLERLRQNSKGRTRGRLEQRRKPNP